MTFFSRGLWQSAVALSLACGLAVAMAGAAHAAEAASKDGTIKITGSWTRATPAGAQVAGGFLAVTNTGSQSDRLTGGSLAIAGKVEVHEMSMSDGIMKMRALEQGLEIKPGETVELKPGGYHLMFIGLTAPVKEGDKIEGTLMFQRAGTIALQFDSVAMGAKRDAHMKH